MIGFKDASWVFAYFGGSSANNMLFWTMAYVNKLERVRMHLTILQMLWFCVDECLQNLQRKFNKFLWFCEFEMDNLLVGLYDKSII